MSGSGNVAQYTVEKLIELGAKAVTLSDSAGFIYDPEGIDRDKLAFVLELKNVKRGRIDEYAAKFKGAKFVALDKTADHNPLWDIKADCRLPERDPERDQRQKTPPTCSRTACMLVAEGANMPTVPAGVEQFIDAKYPLRSR